MLPSSTVENYLKAIYQGQSALASEQRLVPMGQVAASLGVTPGTATTMVKALAESGLAEYEPYSGVRLSAAGERLAGRGEPHAAVRFVFREPRFGKRLDHRRRRPRRHAQRGRDLAHRHEMVVGIERRLAQIDRLQIVFDRARWKHAPVLSPNDARRLDRDA